MKNEEHANNIDNVRREFIIEASFDEDASQWRPITDTSFESREDALSMYNFFYHNSSAKYLRIVKRVVITQGIFNEEPVPDTSDLFL